jgi:hypothetical protein
VSVPPTLPTSRFPVLGHLYGSYECPWGDRLVSAEPGPAGFRGRQARTRPRPRPQAGTAGCWPGWHTLPI